MHAVGLAGLQHLRLAASLLPAAGRLRGDLQGTARNDEVGRVRRSLRQPEVRQLHGELRLRAHGGDGRLWFNERVLGDDPRNIQQLSRHARSQVAERARSAWTSETDSN